MKLYKNDQQNQVPPVVVGGYAGGSGVDKGPYHYANMSIQYTAIFHSCKNEKFKMKNILVFLIFAQNIDCGYTLERPH